MFTVLCRLCTKHWPVVCTAEHVSNMSTRTARNTCFRSPWFRVAVLCVALIAVIRVVYDMDLSDWEAIYRKICQLDYYNYQERMIQRNGSGVIEFPRLYDMPVCDTSKNKSVPRYVCKNLALQMKEPSRQALLRLLRYFDQMATKNDWTYFISFGTLWGSWRNHDLIPWDHDMDLMVEYKDRIDIIEKIEGHQERFVPKQCTHHKIHLHDRDYIIGTTYAQDVGRWYEPSIDMFFFVRNETHIRRSDYPDMYVYKIDDIFPLHRRPLSTLMVPAPRDPLKYLVLNYKSTGICGKYSGPKCEEYKPYLPFVHRKWKDDTMEETLMLNGKVLQVKHVDERKDSITFTPYTLASMRFPN